MYHVIISLVLLGITHGCLIRSLTGKYDKQRFIKRMVLKE